MEAKNLIPHNGIVNLYNGFFAKEESDALLQALISEVPWKQEPIKIFGKEVMQPRLTCWYSDPGVSYKYSGITMTSHDWTDTLSTIRRRIEPVAGTKFNGALLNLYRNGDDSMGWHRDNEKELGKNPVIASVSFGVERVFQLRDYLTKSEKISIALTHGSLLVMAGESQHNWQHRVPAAKAARQPRLNITFRVLRQPKHE